MHFHVAYKTAMTRRPLFDCTFHWNVIEVVDINGLINIANQYKDPHCSPCTNSYHLTKLDSRMGLTDC